MDSITEKDIYKFIKDLLEFPRGQVCNHYVAGSLLDMLERKGHTLDNDLVKHVVKSQDVEALEILDKILQD